MKFRVDRGSAESVGCHGCSRNHTLIPDPATTSSSKTTGLRALGRNRQDPRTDSGQFGWYLRSDRWGPGCDRGHSALARFGFSILNRAMMWATVDPDNLGPSGCWRSLALPAEGSRAPVHTWRGTRPTLIHNRSRTVAHAAGSVGNLRRWRDAPEFMYGAPPRAAPAGTVVATADQPAMAPRRNGMEGYDRPSMISRGGFLPCPAP